MGNKLVNVSVRLNKYSYFQAFKNRLHRNVQMKLKITFENDDNLIFRTGGETGEVVLTKMRLWLPKVKFSGEGEKIYVSEYLKPQVWSFFKDILFSSNSSKERNGVFKIASSIKGPHHVFIWVLNSANNRMINHAQLEDENGINYPETPYIGNEQSKLYTA